MWSRVMAPPLNMMRERFKKRPQIKRDVTRQFGGPIYLLLGNDYRQFFPFMMNKSVLVGDDLYLYAITFKPGQLTRSHR
jgi:hypothetical protein